LWKLEEMAGGLAQPEGWRGNASLLLPGRENTPVHTSSTIRDVRPRLAPWPIRLLLGFGRMLAFMFKTAGVLAVVAFLVGVGKCLHGDLKPSTFLGGPATDPARPSPSRIPCCLRRMPLRRMRAGPNPMPSPTSPLRPAKSRRPRSAGPLRCLRLPARRR
jgi:hypothetical protein